VNPLPPDAPVCTSGKRPIRTEEQARRLLAAARRQAERGDRAGRYVDGGTEGDVYLCKACTWWHLTGANRRKRRGELGNVKNGRGWR